nr:hypothetical protein [Prosthecochloris sp. HL-130-GSB]
MNDIADPQMITRTIRMARNFTAKRMTLCSRAISRSSYSDGSSSW